MPIRGAFNTLPVHRTAGQVLGKGTRSVAQRTSRFARCLEILGRRSMSAKDKSNAWPFFSAYTLVPTGRRRGGITCPHAQAHTRTHKGARTRGPQPCGPMRG